MKRIRRMTALLLCMVMIVPNQGMAALSERETVIENELIADNPEEDSEAKRIQETLPLEPVVDIINTAVYWNPGGSLPEAKVATQSDAQMATQSDAQMTVSGMRTKQTKKQATPSNIAKGNDNADGLTPQHPVRTLEAAFKQVDRLAEKQGMDRSDIIIYAMNPMEIADGSMYVLNAGSARIASWPERTYKNDTVFYLNGGQLALMNVTLEPGDENSEEGNSELIRVDGGTLQLGQNVQINGKTVMDYRRNKDESEWNTATASDATPSNAGTAKKNKTASASSWTEDGVTGSGFDINNYILNTEIDEWELLEDRGQAGTWREPIIEMMEGFNGGEGELLLEVREDDNRNSVVLARTLYADRTEKTEFTSFFRLAGDAAEGWNLISESEKKATVRDTGAADLERYRRSIVEFSLEEDENEDRYAKISDDETAAEMTIKVLTASRAYGAGATIYWNPGGEITVGGETYPVGDDKNNSGLTPLYPVKTLNKAMESAAGGTIYAMQAVNLADEDAGISMPSQENGAWVVKALDKNMIPTLKMWEVKQDPIFRVGPGETLVLEDITIEGPLRSGETVEGRAIQTMGGDVVIRSGVTAESGCIEMDATADLKNHWIQADSTDGVSVTLFFSGINEDLRYLYTDVVKPTENLLSAGADEAAKTEVGAALLGCYQISPSNKTEAFGGSSRYDWTLRQDTEEDDQDAAVQNLELYAEFYYDAVYLNGMQGDDNATGAFCDTPVRNWSRAREIWEEQMKRSIAARKSASDRGMTAENINKQYPYPDTIYICNTVTISTQETWQLTTMTDYDGTVIKAEVASHCDIPNKEGTTEPVHTLPQYMISIDSGGQLDLVNVTLRNDTNLPDSATIRVDGGILHVDGTSSMTGSVKKENASAITEATGGTHIQALNGATVLLESTVGNIESRQQGITADGTNTQVAMNGGTIQKNRCRQNLPGDNGKNGGGVSLSGGASFFMSGGTITENSTSECGGGVYLTGTGTTFRMQGGTITKNTVRRGAVGNATAYGMGIYGASGTEIYIGNDSSSALTTKVNDNSGQEGIFVKGGGIYSEGKLTVKNAAVCDNVLPGNNPYGSGDISYGAGIYASGTLTMDSAEVSGNRFKVDEKAEGMGAGAGVCIISNGDNIISNSTVQGNIIGDNDDSDAYYSGLSTGGGIYVKGKLSIIDSSISGNFAKSGAGICAGDKTADSSDLSITRCNIIGNQSSGSLSGEDSFVGSGDGAGVYLRNGKAVLTDCHIKENQKSGLFVYSGSIKVAGSSKNSMEITDNKGAGIYLYRSGSIAGENILVKGNKGSGIINDAISGVLYLRKAEICENTAEKGGGIFSDGDIYLEDVKIDNNRAVKNEDSQVITSGCGGGIYARSKLYWSETTEGGSCLTGNIAENGGGIYVDNYNDSYQFINFKGKIQNVATVQGSNIYGSEMKGGVLTGRLSQPEDSVNGVYNVYLSGDKGSVFYMDPKNAVIERKTDENPDSVYLEKSPSCLTIYRTEGDAELCVDVNRENFVSGSIIVKPADKSAETFYIPNKELTGTIQNNVSFGTALKDASGFLEQIRLSQAPSRTQLASGKDEQQNTLTNIILLAQGVYLSSQGKDTNEGTSPEDAVATFAKAKEVLNKRISDQKTMDDLLPESERTGFAPYIYICGNVLASDNETWTLDYEDDLFVTDNIAFLQAERKENPDIPEMELKAQVRRFASFVAQPMITVGDGSRAAELILDRIIIDGRNRYVDMKQQSAKSPIIYNKKNSTVRLNGDAQICNNYDTGIENEGAVYLNGNEADVNRQVCNIDGNAIKITGESGTVSMDGYSRIVKDEEGFVTKPVQGDQKGIYGSADKITVSMDEHSRIESTATTYNKKFGRGIDIGNNGKLQMKGDSCIKNTVTAVYLGGSNISFEMNAESGAGKEDSAQIVNASSAGIGIYGDDINIKMGKYSQITSGGLGISMYATNRGGAGISLNMDDNSSIKENSGYGIEVSENNKGPVNINMQKNTRISKNSTGIYGNMYGYSSSFSGADQVTITMKGGAQISSNKKEGIYLKGDFWKEDSYQKIIMGIGSIIGSVNNDYSADLEDSGNGGSGIKTFAPTEILISDLAVIAHNGDSGISLERNTSLVKEASKVTLSNYCGIEDNRNYGIYNPDMKGIYGAVNPSMITLQDECHIVRNSRDSEGNTGQTAEIFLNKYSELHMQNTPMISAGINEADAVTSDGKIFMGGNEEITGRIHLTNVGNPITLKAIPGAGKQFHLHLVESFMGKPVVIPDGTEIQDTSQYLSCFIKDIADGEAKEKPLVSSFPNIILEGDNNVYLSQNGNDSNDGLSPETAVRTFEKAKELLQTGYYTKGANILICDTIFLYDTVTWSFDEDGMVTNQKTGERWTPMIQRYKSCTRNLIQVGADATLYLENIIIDGNKENSEAAKGSLVYATYTSKVVLGKGAVLQNNKVISNYAGGLEAAGAAVVIDGGILRGMEAEAQRSNDRCVTAILVRDVGSDYPGVVNFVSGQIYNNTIVFKDGAEYVYGGAVCVTSQADFTMSGGMIYNNRNDSRAANPGVTEGGKGAGIYIDYGGAVEITGGVISGNSGVAGSAIYCAADRIINSLILSGGVIKDNTTNQYVGKDPIGEFAPIHVENSDFQLKGGGCDIQDGIYLKGTKSRIKVSGSIYQKNRNYKIYLDEGSAENQYQKGSPVVIPDGSGQTDVTQYQPYFSLYSDNYVLDYGHSAQPVEEGSIVREDRSLVLMKPVFLDGTRGDDSHDGMEPGQAVKTFTEAVTTGKKGAGKQDYYVVYVCGETGNTEEENIWNMEAPAYLCRYTGFPLYKRDGSTRYGEGAAYYGNLITPQRNLEIGHLEVYGRRASDAITCIGESLFKIPAGVTVTVGGDGNAVFGRNRNIGQYTAEGESLPKSLSGKGGAFCVEPRGTLVMSSGRISDVDAVYGSAVYLGTEDAAGTNGSDTGGQLKLDQTPAIRGTVYLSGSSMSTAAYVEPMTGYAPDEPLQLSIGNDYDGRTCVRYPDGTSPDAEKLAFYSFEESIKSLYVVGYREDAGNVIELKQKAIFYLDGEAGSATYGGMEPDRAVKAIGSVFDHMKIMQEEGTLKTGAVVYVVGTVTLDGQDAESNKNVTIGSFKNADGTYTSFYKDASGRDIRISGQISFKRYVRPTAYADAHDDLSLYSRESFTGSLFELKNGATLSLYGITLDGHAQDMKSSNHKIAAKGIEAQAPLVVVKGGQNTSSGYTGGGSLNCGYAKEGTAVSTRFQNNINVNRKSNSLGQWQGSNITEGSAAGIELVDGETGGICHLNHTEFVNLELGSNVAAGGTDVYHNGAEMSFSSDMLFSGSVFLEGLGSADEPKNSRFMTVDAYGGEARSPFQVLMRDPYKGRKVVSYPENTNGPAADDIALYHLEEQVTERYGLLKRDGEPWILELKVPAAVYIDGGKGNDASDGATANQPVQTLKRAYELLNSRAGNTIYVVGTVPIEQSIQLYGNKYEGPDGTVLLRSADRVRFIRYIQPDFANNIVALSGSIRAAGFDVTDFAGTMFSVKNGGMLTAKNITFDGHSQPKQDSEYPKEITVSRNTRSKAPIISVEDGAEAVLSEGTILRCNDNAYDGAPGSDMSEENAYGGAVGNAGIVTVDGTVFENNHSLKGDAAYQGGSFILQSNLEGMAEHSFYLASSTGGTAEHPVYEDTVLTIAQSIPENQIIPIDMDENRAIPGRDVIRFSDSAAYAPAQGADAEYTHFALGSMVPEELMLVEAADDPSVLELQDWKVLDVEVPSDIYLTMVRDQTTDNGGVMVGSVQKGMTGFFAAPEYRITNHGRYDVKVSVSGMEDLSTNVGIKADPINLKQTAAETTDASALYLAVKGTEKFTAAETALTDTGLIELGSLNAGESGTFEFTGTAADSFIDKYKDREIPLTGDADAIQSYMDGTSPDRTIHACAKYLLKYKVELIQPRRP